MIDEEMYRVVSQAIGAPVDNVAMCEPKYELSWHWKVLNLINPFFKTVPAAQMIYLASRGPQIFLVTFQKKQPFVEELPLSALSEVQIQQIHQGMSTELKFRIAGARRRLVVQSYLPHRPDEYNYARVQSWQRNLIAAFAVARA